MKEKKTSALGVLIKIFAIMVSVCAVIAGISIAVYKAVKKKINKKPAEDDADLEIAVIASDDEEEKTEEEKGE
ncbi:MAG: hypothetical protein IJW54_07415 [Clostridia bacterium]|nr:hypothetical protein [Clostridia bacterium]